MGLLKKYIIYITCFASLFPQIILLNAQKQNIAFQHLTVEDGLSLNSIHKIIKDKKGFLWIGTENGLNKYDGYDFEVYQHNPLDTNSLSGNWVVDILEDSHGDLWIGTYYYGLNLFDRETNKFIRYTHNNENQFSISNNNITAIFEDSKANLWIGTLGGGLNLYNRQNNVFKRFLHDSIKANSIGSNYISSIAEDSKGNLWIGTTEGLLCSYNDFTNNFENFKIYNRHRGSLYSSITGNILVDSKDNVWYGTEYGFFIFNQSTNEINHYYSEAKKNSLSNNTVTYFAEDENELFWIATDHGGINLFDKKNKTFTHYKNNKSDNTSISNNQVYTIYNDYNIIWFGNFRGGINIFNKNAIKFKKYKDILIDEKREQCCTSVISLCEDRQGNIWIGTDGDGINIFNPAGKTVQQLKHDPKNLNSISTNIITTLYKDSNDDIWIGTYLHGMSRYDWETKKFEHFKNEPENDNSISSNNIWAILEDKQRNIWIGTLSEGLDLYDKSNNKFTHFRSVENDTLSLTNNSIHKIYEDSRGNIWIGTRSGLNRVIKGELKFKQYVNHPNNPNSLFGNLVNDIIEDENGNLWIGTDKALNLYMPDTDGFSYFNEKQGLNGNNVFGVAEDDNNNIWVSTNKGISRFDLETKKFRHYDLSDGLQGNEFNQATVLVNKKGTIYFGGTNGLNYFHPDSIEDNQNIPPIVITDFKLFNKSVNLNSKDSPLTKHINYTKEIKLSYKQSVFTIEYAALNYTFPQENEYAFILEGFENDWNYVGTRRSATYTNLDPGKYIFKVKGSNNDGIWNEEGTYLHIIITPPFWKTWWFRITILIIFLSALYIAHLFNVRKIKKQREKLELMVYKRTFELEERNEEIIQQKEQLNESYEEISTQNEKLLSTMKKLKVAQEQMVQSEKMASLGVLTAGIAHEINNPINFIYSGINSLKKDFDDLQVIIKEVEKLKPGIPNLEDKLKQIKELEKEYYFDEACEAIPQTIEDISVGIERTVEIVNGLRQFSRLGNEPYKPVDIHQSIDNALLLLKNKYKNQISIIRNYSNSLPLINCCQGKVMQVFMNIIGNSIDSIEEKGKITIETKQNGDAILVTIKDTGIGMDEATRQKIFDPFFTTKEVGKGTGLGMAIVYGILNDHNAEIEVKSELGKGTDIYISFPIQR